MIKAHLFGGQEHGRSVEIERNVSCIEFLPAVDSVDCYCGKVLPDVVKMISYKFDKMLSEEDAVYILREG
tara:strand:- start:881 stop:1090 length:210 start_codon:yes stop_codon:yes gene_type:complete